MIGVIDVEIQAMNPNMPLHPWRAFAGSPSSARIRNVPRKIGDWQIDSVQLVAAYPNGEIKTAQCVHVGGVWVGTVPGCDMSGKGNYSVYASGTDENGQAVSDYCLGKGEVEILESDGSVTPGTTLAYVHLLSAQSETPHDGDLWQVSGTYYLYQDGQAWPIGDDSGLIAEISAKIETKADLSALNSKADLSAVHGDYIEDAEGNKIEADLGYIHSNSHDPWTFSGVTLNYDSTSNTWIGDDGGTKYVLEYDIYSENLWKCAVYDWIMEEWYYRNTDIATGAQNATSLYFSTLDTTMTRSASQSQRLATESYVSGIVGNINSILDTINGEVI